MADAKKWLKVLLPIESMNYVTFTKGYVKLRSKQIPTFLL